MNNSYLTIGQMAQLNHISAQTLRLYDSEGLIKPIFQSRENGYRYYHISQCMQLDMIHTMKLCGMSLKQIRELLDNGSPEDWDSMLSRQEEVLEQKMKQLSDSRKSLRRLNANIHQLNSLPPLGEVFLENMPERKIDTLATEYNYFTDGFSGYELMLRRLKDRMIQHELPLSYFYNAGTLIEKEDFTAHNYIAQTVFIFVDSDYPKVDTLRTLPAGTYLAVCSDDPDNELQYTEKLYAKIGEMGYEVAGEYLCEVISQMPFSANPTTSGKDRHLIYKAQVPVKKRSQSE